MQGTQPAPLETYSATLCEISEGVATYFACVGPKVRLDCVVGGIRSQLYLCVTPVLFERLKYGRNMHPRREGLHDSGFD